MSGTLVRVELGVRAYPIHIGASLIDRAALYSPHVSGRLAARYAFSLSLTGRWLSCSAFLAI